MAKSLFRKMLSITFSEQIHFSKARDSCEMLTVHETESEHPESGFQQSLYSLLVHRR